MAGKPFRFWPDQTEWFRMLTDAIRSGEDADVELVREVGFHRERELEQYLSRLGKGGGGAAALRGTVVAYSSVTRLADVVLDSGPTLTGVPNFTAFPLNVGYRAEVVYDEQGPVVLGHQQVGLPPAPPPHAQIVVTPGFPLSMGSLTQDSNGTRTGPRWTLDDDNVLGMGAGAIVITASSTNRVRVYSPSNLLSYIELPAGSSGGTLFFFGGALFTAIEGSNLRRFDPGSGTWVTVVGNRTGRQYGVAGDTLYYSNFADELRAIDASDPTSSFQVFASSGVTLQGLLVGTYRSWHYSTTGSTVHPPKHRVTSPSSSFPWTTVSSPPANFHSAMNVPAACVEDSTGAFVAITTGAGGGQFRAFHTDGSYESYTGIFPADVSSGRPVWITGILPVGGGSYLVSGGISKQATTGNPAHADVYMPRIWVVSRYGSDIEWEGTEEAAVSPGAMSGQRGAFAGGMTWVPGLEGVRMRWQVTAAPETGPVAFTLYEGNVSV